MRKVKKETRSAKKSMAVGREGN